MKKEFTKRSVWFSILLVLVVVVFIICQAIYFKSNKNSNHSSSENDLNLAPSEQAQNYSESNTSNSSSTDISSVPVIVSSSSNQTKTSLPVALANPASKNCVAVGGKLEIKKNAAGGEYGLCYFEDNMACEEWTLFRGECPVGGIKTTGFDIEAQSYCAWLGGETFATDNAVCKFKDGSSCLDTDLYSDLCHKGEEK